MGQPQKILVDLTPLLPGGVNGGAKPFLLALLKELSDRQPDASFTAVVRQDVFGEVATMTKPNLLFKVLDVSNSETGGNSRLLGSQRLHLIRQRGLKLLKRLWQAIPNNSAKPDLLYCPFGPTLLERKGVPIVSTFHDLQVQAYPNFFNS